MKVKMYDIEIIGGGPAGVTLARLIGQKCMDIASLENRVKV